MSFTDPLSLNLGAGAISLPRTSVRENGTTYTSNDGTLVVSADHAYGRRNRRVLRVDQTKISADPFLPDTNTSKSMSHYMVFDAPPVGFTSAEMLVLFTAFQALYGASSNAMITKLLGGES